MKKNDFKRLYSFLTGIWLILFAVPLASALDSADPSTDILIVYSGDMQANVEPDGCCFLLGGIARTGTVIDNFRKEYPRVMVLDSGDFLWNWKWSRTWDNTMEALHPVETAFMYRAMKMISYDAMHMADGEILSGPEFLKTFGSDDELPLVSLNVTVPADSSVRPKPYIIRQFDNVRIAVTGLTHPDMVQDKAPDGFRVDDPAETLRRHIQDIRAQADIIVLLSHLGWDHIRSLLEQVDDIDIIISGHETYPTFEPEKIGKTLIVKTARGGGLIGTIRIKTDPQTGQVETMTSDLIMVEEKVTPLPVFAQMESDFQQQKSRLSSAVSKETQLDEAEELFKKMDEAFSKLLEN